MALIAFERKSLAKFAYAMQQADNLVNHTTVYVAQFSKRLFKDV